MLESQQDAQDALQDSLIKAAKSIDRIRQSESTDSWFVKIAMNSALDRIRKRSRTCMIPSGSFDDLATQHRAAVSPGTTPENAALLSEAIGFLSSLPEKHRLAYLMRHFLGLPPSDIADILDCESKHVSTYINRAQRAVERYFEDSGR